MRLRSCARRPRVCPLPARTPGAARGFARGLAELCCAMHLLTFILLLAGAGTADWPRFRGPNGTGIQESGRLPAELGATRNVVWKTALPPGYSSPVVSGDRIFLTGFEGDTLLTIA